MTSVDKPHAARKQPRKSSAPSHPDAPAILRHVLTGLAGLRTDSSHFPGYFLGIDWRIDERSLEGAMVPGPQSVNTDGSVNLAAFSVLLDTAVAIGSRLKLPTGMRQATVQLHAQFTGQPLRGPMRVIAEHEGHSSGPGVHQAFLRASVSSNGKPVCYATSAFVHLPSRPGTTQGPHPRQRVHVADLAPLEAHDLDARERAVLEAGTRALKRADSRHAFIEHFWHVLPRVARGGARCDVTLGTHFGNRSGVVQGGILFGIAAATAQVAAPRHRHLSNVSAWYVGAGRGKRLTARSKTSFEGRSYALVRTSIVNEEGQRVLETVSHHAA